MPEKFKFTQEDLDDMVLEALDAGTGRQKGEGGTKKPNVIQKLLAGSKLGNLRKQV